MKILLTGASGLLGWELQRSLAVLGPVLAPDSALFNLAEPAGMVRALREWQPELVVNAAAYTAVDRAESEPALAMTLNAHAPGVLAEECRRLGVMLLHYSTDYVFDGSRSGSYAETDEPAPVNVYGRSKLAGERAIQQVGCRHLIVRTGWLYGVRRPNFVSRISELLTEQSEVPVVADQIGSPCWVRWLAEATAFMLAARAPQAWAEHGELYHLAPAASASRYELAMAVRELSAGPGMPRPVATADYPLPARRPANSLLDCSRVEADFGLFRPDWRQLLALFMADGQAWPARGLSGR